MMSKFLTQVNKCIQSFIPFICKFGTAFLSVFSSPYDLMAFKYSPPIDSGLFFNLLKPFVCKALI